jgi:hypothetical protein
VISSTYTYAKSFDLFSGAAIGEVSNPYNLSFDRGLSDFDRTHVFNASAVWEIPFLRSSKELFVKNFIAGWQLSGLVQLQSGLPFNVTDGQDISHTGIGLDRPNVIGNPVLSASRPRATKVIQYFNTAAYAYQAVGTFGNSQRNSIFGLGYEDADLALMKNFNINETTRFQFRAEAFNALNHVNLANPDGKVSDGANFGRITSASDPRLIQGALKFYF